MGITAPLLYIAMYSGKVVPGPLNVMVGVTTVAPTWRLTTLMVVVCNKTAVAGLTRGSPLKKLTGTLSEIGKLPLLIILKYALIARSPQIGGVTTTVGEYTPSPFESTPGLAGLSPK